LEEHFVTLLSIGVNHFEGVELLNRLEDGWKLVEKVCENKLLVLFEMGKRWEIIHFLVGFCVSVSSRTCGGRRNMFRPYS
jgi:hypothetical protein